MMSVISRRVRAVAAIVAAAGFAVTATSTAAGANPKSAGGSVVEASVIAYTGSNSFEGGVTDAGLYPAAYEINSAGGILGHKLSIDPVDTRGDPADALPLVEKMLATTPNLVGVTGCGTTSGPTLIPVFNSDHVVMMCAAGEAKYDRNKNKYFWRLVPPDPANGIAMAIWAKRHKLTSVAAVFGTTSSAQGDLPGVLAGVKDAHMKLVANIGLTPDQPSYRTQVEQLISDHPQVIMTESDGPTAATFFGELKQLGGGHLVPIYGTEATVTSSWLKPVRGAIGTVDFNKYFTGIIGGTPAPSPALTAYAKAVKKTASKLVSPATQWDSNPYSQAFYDGVIVQALAMEAAHSTKMTVYNNYITKVTEPGPHKVKVYTFSQGVKDLAKGKQIEYIGASGPIKFDKFHNSFGNEAAEAIPSKGKARVLGTITEQAIQKLG